MMFGSKGRQQRQREIDSPYACVCGVDKGRILMFGGERRGEFSLLTVRHASLYQSRPLTASTASDLNFAIISSSPLHRIPFTHLILIFFGINRTIQHCHVCQNLARHCHRCPA